MQRDRRYGTIPIPERKNQPIQKKLIFYTLLKLLSMPLLLTLILVLGTFVITVLVLGKTMKIFVDLVTIEGIILVSIGGILALAWPGALYSARGPVQTALLAKVTTKEHTDGTRQKRMRDIIQLGLLGMALIGISMIIGIIFINT